MDSNVKISIGIPIYNAERFLESAIKSVLNQSFKEFELILSDDGSTDSSLEIASSFNDSRIRIINDDQNMGIAFRLNEQIRLARGKYFARMDADDLMDPERIKEQLAYLEENPVVDVLGTSATIIDSKNMVIGFRSSLVHSRIEQVFRKVSFIHPTVTGKTEWFRQYGYNDDLIGAEDVDLWIRSFQHSSFRTIDRPLLYYRDSPEIKVKTYLFRHRQLRRTIWTNRYRIKRKPLLLFNLLLQSYCKGILMVLAKRLNFDDYLIKKRNETYDSALFEEYQGKLDLLLIL